MLQKSQKQQQIVFETSLLWSFTSKRRKSVLLTFFLGNIRKVSFFAFGSKLQKIFSITCLIVPHLCSMTQLAQKEVHTITDECVMQPPLLGKFLQNSINMQF